MNNKKIKNMKGIGGWLIFFLIGIIVLTFISLLAGLVKFEQIFITQRWFFNLGLGMFLMLCDISVAVVGIYSLVLMFKKKKSFINVAIFTVWYSFGISAFTLLLIEPTLFISWIPKMIAVTIGNIITTMYYRQSKRVKNTFVK